MEKIHFLEKPCHLTALKAECSVSYCVACGEIATFDALERKWDLLVTKNWSNVTCKRCMDKHYRDIVWK